MWRKLFPRKPGTYIYALVGGLLIVFLVLRREGFDRIYGYVSGLTTAGILLILVGLLMLCIYCGAGDALSYSITRFRETHRKTDDRERLTKQSYFDYVSAQKEKRSHKAMNFMSYVIVGLAFMIVGLIVEFAFIH